MAHSYLQIIKLKTTPEYDVTKLNLTIFTRYSSLY